MHRYSAASGVGVGNSVVGGASARENTRADSSFSSSSFSLSSRRQPQLASYKLKCDKEPLNNRLGPPDFFPQTPICAEETLSREYLLSGYKETVEGIEEAREITLSQASTFSKPEYILKCKEALRKRLRAINESRAQKRKAGQVYGVPLSGQLLTKLGVFPEQRPCSEESRRKWIEALSQQHKPLRSLAEHVPHGYRRSTLFEVLIRYNVPLIKATWFIKVTYLNQVRPNSTNVSAGVSDKAQFARADSWTKDIIEYLQHLLVEFFSKDGIYAATSSRDQSSQIFMSSQASRRGDFASTSPDSEEPSLHFKWWYMLRLIQWHFAEGLLLPSLIIEWVLHQLQEKESAEVFELVLPIIIDLIDCIALSQTYVRMLVDLFVRSINKFSSGCSNAVDTLRKSPLVSVLVEILRYLILVVPDTFVALDCFPLPTCVVPDLQCKNAPLRLHGVDNAQFESEDAYLSYLSTGYIASSIQKHINDLAKTVNPGFQARGAAKVVQALDKAFIMGDLRFAYNSIFEDLSDASSEARWIADVSPCLRSSLKWIGTVDMSLICAVFFLCEWATCDYRDCRTSMPQNVKLSGRTDFSPIYFAVLLLKLKMAEMLNSSQKDVRNVSNCVTALCGSMVEHSSGPRDSFKSATARNSKRAIFQSPGPLHDIIVCWLDQHETSKVANFRDIEILLMELIRNGIFFPQVYVRQLIVSGIMDKNENSSDLERWKRHHHILKQLPGYCMFDLLEEAKIAERPLLAETVCIYSNERRLVLHGVFHDNFSHLRAGNDSGLSFSQEKDIDHHSAIGYSKQTKRKDQLARIKVLISHILHFPHSYQGLTEMLVDEPKGTSKRMLGSNENKFDLMEDTTGCEECRRAKRQKKTDERSSTLQRSHSSYSDDEDSWWVRRGPKSQESFKAEPPLKSSKHASRGRQKTVRKTQSLAQLATASRIESSQGASTSHVCDNKVSCPHHKSVSENEAPKDANQIIPASLVNFGNVLKKLRLLERRLVATWLLKSMKQLIEGNEKPSSKINNCTDAYSLPADGRSTVRWRLGEDELLSILYILDSSCDLVSVARFLIWLLPRSFSGSSTTGQGARSILLSRNRENQVCQFGEAFLFTSLQRYENVLLAADLLPEVLSAAIHRSASIGRPAGAVGFAYARNLLRKYKEVPNVAKWEKNFRATCDQRLLAELDFGRALDGEFLFSSSASVAGEDTDDHIRLKMSGRISRSDPKMKELLQLHVEEAVHYYYGKERKFNPLATAKNHTFEKWDDSYQIAQNIVLGLYDCIRQNSGASPDGDPHTIVSAVSAIISSVGSTVAKLGDLAASSNSMICARHILQIHIFSLCLLKEALGDRLSRVFEIAFATEAYSAISGAFAPARANRSQFQPSPETNDIYQNHSNDQLANSTKLVGRATRTAAAVSALVIGAIVHGASTLDRMLTAFRLKEGLDVLQFIRSARSTSNGISRPASTMKQDNSIEVYVHFFRLLIGNCRTIFDGLISDILGESYMLALSRMQHRLPLNLVSTPAYSIFAMVIWRPYILNSNIATREDVQLYQNLSLAVSDVIRHKPFRDLIFRNIHGFYDILASDSCDSEFAAMLELYSPDKYLKTTAFLPTRAKLFMNALVDCKMPGCANLQEDGSWGSGPTDPRAYSENEAKLFEQLVHILDTLQPAKFHWQWIELRLLLNEQALIEKIEGHKMSFVEAIRSLSPAAENLSLSESEKKFTEIILTRILARPDAASLYSEVVHLLGKSLQESLVVDTKWILTGPDVSSGRKSIRQHLMYLAQRKGLSTRTQFWKPWGWSSSTSDTVSSRGDKRKSEAVAIEEGEVVDESIDVKKFSKVHNTDAESFSCYQYITEKALAELILPCIDRSSSDVRNVFASELIKQMGSIEQQINLITRTGKANVVPSGVEGSSNKGSNRKAIRGGSPVLGRRTTGLSDTSPASIAALKALIWLRLQFLLRLLPLIYVDSGSRMDNSVKCMVVENSKESPTRNMRQTLASIIIRLLGTRVVYEDAELSLVAHVDPYKREAESLIEDSLLDHSSDSLFDRLLYVLYCLLSNCKSSWLKPKSAYLSTSKSSKDFSVFDREAAESLQMDLDRMELPATIRRRIQAAMPVLAQSLSLSAACHPPTLSSATLAAVQSSVLSIHQKVIPSARTSNNPSSRSKGVVSQDADLEIDPWTLLEDCTGSVYALNTNSNMGGLGVENSNLKACCWLKGAVRVRRTDLTYVGAMDEDS